MKILLTSVLFIGSLISLGQTISQYSLLDNTNLWSVMDIYDADCSFPCEIYPYIKTTWYKIGNESTINGLIYKELLKATDSRRTNWSGAGFLRQVDKQIYFYNGSREYLLYDFGLEVGQTTKLYLYDSEPDYYFESRLDSIREDKYTGRKIYYFTQWPSDYPKQKTQEIWMEGIGSLSDGLLRQRQAWIDLSGHYYSLVCFFQYVASGGVHSIYHDNHYLSCYYNLVDDVSLLEVKEDIQVLPNPGTGIFSIQFKNNQACYHLQVLTLSGTIVGEYEAGFTSLKTVDLSTLSKGVYLFKFKSEKGVFTRKVILK